MDNAKLLLIMELEEMLIDNEITLEEFENACQNIHEF